MTKNIIIQGVRGCFHEEAANHYYQHRDLEFIEAETFEDLAHKLHQGVADRAIMAIENSIAGSILQNYRIIREYGFRVIGEIYHRIKLNVMTLPDVSFDHVEVIKSHPMAINQSLEFLRQYPHIAIEESSDTALSVKNIVEHQERRVAAIASQSAADLYQMRVHHSGIESDQTNYTRFFILSKSSAPAEEVDKASIYIRVEERAGALVEVLNILADHHINMTKLQSYPVMGSLQSYYMHIDLEFDDINQYEMMKSKVMPRTKLYKEFGIYQKDRAFHKIIEAS